MKEPKHFAQIILSVLALTLTSSLAPPGLGAQPDPQPTSCGHVADLTPLLQSGTVLLLGELHGTVEVPQFVADTTCLALAAGHRVTVGLEIPKEEKAVTSAYLESNGLPEDRATLLHSTFWQSSFKDGRTSEAMLDLIEQLRRLKQAGKPVELALLDSDGVKQRDHAMAEQLEKTIAASPKSFFVVLTGNLHNRMIRGASWDEKWEPMGYLVSRRMPRHRFFSLDLSFTEGTAWFCGTDACKEHRISGKGVGESRKIILHESLNSSGYHGIFHVGSVTASPPVDISLE